MGCSGGEGLPRLTTLSHLSWDSSRPTQAQTTNTSALAAPLPSLSSHSTPVCPPPSSAQGTQTGTGLQASTPGAHHGHNHPHAPPPIPTLLPSFPRPGHFGAPPAHHHPTDQQKGTACSSLTPRKHAELLHGVRLQPRETSASTAFGNSKGIRVQI